MRLNVITNRGKAAREQKRTKDGTLENKEPWYRKKENIKGDCKEETEDRNRKIRPVKYTSLEANEETVSRRTGWPTV